MAGGDPENASNVDLLMAITRLETKVDAFTSQQADHEVRIRALESQRWPARSVALLVSLAALFVSASSVLTYR